MEFLRKKPGLLVVNYHRLGSSAGNAFDDDLFLPNPGEFRSQLLYLRENFDMINLEGLIRMAEGGFALDRPCVLITFDDGYRDNFEVGFPILRELGLPAVFFIATEFIQSSRLPWWDRIACSIKKTEQKTLTLDYPTPISLELGQNGRLEAIRQVQAAYTRADRIDASAFFNQLEERLQVRVDMESLGRRLFMSWEQVRALRHEGMDIGAHTHTHPVLARLAEPDQWKELVESKTILESELQEEVIVLAYPVGRKDCFTSETKRLAEKAGYRLAFSYEDGINLAGRTDPF